MKREILFRGFVEFSISDKTIQLNGKEIKGYWADCSECGNVKHNDLYPHFFGYLIPSFVKCVPETVGQYTGLTDKNGKKIFEGDIVKVTYTEKRSYNGVPYDNEYSVIEQIVYDESNSCFMLKITLDGIDMYRPLCNENDAVRIKEIEVIGNVYENPELLEVNE